MSIDFRTQAELEENALLFWPTDIYKEALSAAFVDHLLSTQQIFLNILRTVDNLESLFAVVESSDLSPNSFTKHLVVLSDFGIERFKRLNRHFNRIFPSGELDYQWCGEQHTYRFESLPVKGQLTPARLYIEVDQLLQPQLMFTNLQKDIVALLLFANTSACQTARETSFFVGCDVGEYLSQSERLNDFVRQRYIWVSKITNGSLSNKLGHIIEDRVVQHIKSALSDLGVEVDRDGTLPGVTDGTVEGEEKLTNFDIVVSRGGNMVGIEVAFQVTSNSVIERKGGQVEARFNKASDRGFRVAYVIDGAGYFARPKVMRTILSYSHCTVNMTIDELNRLCDFMRDYFSGL